MGTWTGVAGSALAMKRCLALVNEEEQGTTYGKGGW